MHTPSSSMMEEWMSLNNLTSLMMMALLHDVWRILWPMPIPHWTLAAGSITLRHGLLL